MIFLVYLIISLFNCCLMAVFQDNCVSRYQRVSILDFIGVKDDGSGEW